MANRPPSYFGSSDELREIRERRNEEIRAWGKKVLADADALLGVPTELIQPGDWDQINLPEEDQDEEVESAIVDSDVPKAKTPRTPKPKAE